MLIICIFIRLGDPKLKLSFPPVLGGDHPCDLAGLSPKLSKRLACLQTPSHLKKQMTTMWQDMNDMLPLKASVDGSCSYGSWLH